MSAGWGHGTNLEMIHRIAVVIVLLACAVAARAQVPTPTVDGPITSPGSAFVASTSFDLGQVGYRQEEYFLSGTATAYTSAAPLTSDGAWSVTPGDTAGYKTRILVNRPIDPKKFNGTVVVEWLNVSGGLDAAPDWIARAHEIIRDGCAWVGVSAQNVGVEAGARRSASSTCRSRRSIPPATARSSIPATASRTTSSRRPAQALRAPPGRVRSAA